MVTVAIIRCQGCGANLSPSNTNCEYCGSVNVIKAKENLFVLDESLSKKYVNYYKEKVKEIPSDGEAIFFLGLFYLRLKLYDFAIKNIEKSIELMPEESDVYFYYALALMKGRKPKLISLTEIRKIEDYLKTAIQLNDTNANYFYLWALIKYDFYLKNGLRSQTPTLDYLLDEIKSKNISTDEIEKLRNMVPVTDFNL